MSFLPKYIENRKAIFISKTDVGIRKKAGRNLVRISSINWALNLTQDLHDIRENNFIFNRSKFLKSSLQFIVIFDIRWLFTLKN